MQSELLHTVPLVKMMLCKCIMYDAQLAVCRRSRLRLGVKADNNFFDHRKLCLDEICNLIRRLGCLLDCNARVDQSEGWKLGEA